MDNIILAKVATIEKCLKRIDEEASKDWKKNFTFQDALLLNLERACQATIDCAAHLVSKMKLGLPKQARDTFDLLEEADLIDASLSKSMKKMVGFRNLAVHDYATLNLDILDSILDKELDSFTRFNTVMINLQKD